MGISMLCVACGRKDGDDRSNFGIWYCQNCLDRAMGIEMEGTGSAIEGWNLIAQGDIRPRG